MAVTFRAALRGGSCFSRRIQPPILPSSARTTSTAARCLLQSGGMYRRTNDPLKMTEAKPWNRSFHVQPALRTEIHACTAIGNSESQEALENGTLRLKKNQNPEEFRSFLESVKDREKFRLLLPRLETHQYDSLLSTILSQRSNRISILFNMNPKLLRCGWESMESQSNERTDLNSADFKNVMKQIVDYPQGKIAVKYSLTNLDLLKYKMIVELVKFLCVLEKYGKISVVILPSSPSIHPAGDPLVL